MRKKLLVTFACLSVTGCAGVVQQPANPEITAQIVNACKIDGIFQDFGGRLVLSSAISTVPFSSVASGLIEAGVDKVCENPEKFSSDVSTAIWVVKNIRDIVKDRLNEKKIQ